MKKILTFGLVLAFSSGLAQTAIAKKLHQLNRNSVPYIKPIDASKKKDVVFLDAREPEEYNVSHIQNAKFVGYDNFDEAEIKSVVKSKTTPIVVYCSIGVRSERIGEKLQQMGYTNVQNLFGGIFEWKNQGLKVYDPKNLETEKVHTYSKKWSKFLKKGVAIYD